MRINVGPTFYVNYAFDLSDALCLTRCFGVHFPHTQSVRLFSKVPFGTYESLKSRCPIDAKCKGNGKIF